MDVLVENHVRQWRRARGLTLEELTARTSEHLQTLTGSRQAWHGKTFLADCELYKAHFTLLDIALVARAIGVYPYQLITFMDDPPPRCGCDISRRDSEKES